MELTFDQKQAVEQIDRNLQIIACAGSGKTEVISRRIANILNTKDEILPGDIVAFTFTEKAAQSINKRILKALVESNYPKMDLVSDMYIGTIHGFCFQLLKEKSSKYKDYKVLDNVKRHLFTQKYFDCCGIKDLQLTKSKYDINLFSDIIDKMVCDFNNQDEWEREHISTFERYRSLLHEKKYLDFSFLIFETLQEIKDNSDVSAYLESVKYLVVDEYQDVDDMQEKLIELIANNGTNVCVVGDDDQTIYQFRGSNADHMINFKSKYHDVAQVMLKTNFRCGEGIVDVADKVISKNSNRIEKSMNSGAIGVSNIEILECDSIEDECRDIAIKIEELSNSKIQYRDIAILVRKNKHISYVNKALNEAGIPYIAASSEYFFEGEYFKRFADSFRVIDELDKPLLFSTWDKVLGRDKILSGFKYLRQASIRGGDATISPLSKIINEFLEKTSFLEDVPDTQARLDDLNGFSRILEDYDEIFGEWQLSARVRGVISFIENKAFEEYKYHNFKNLGDNENAVNIMTVHKSKGLEFDTVFMLGLEEGEFPSGNMRGRRYWHVLGGAFEENKEKYQNDIDDERKMFYVAVTRAINNLFMYYCKSKKGVSRFVLDAARSSHIKMVSQ